MHILTPVYFCSGRCGNLVVSRQLYLRYGKKKLKSRLQSERKQDIAHDSLGRAILHMTRSYTGLARRLYTRIYQQRIG
jgi:hypothetical protein